MLAAWGDTAPDANAVVAPDPRLQEAGWRVLARGGHVSANADMAEWDRHRLALGLPDGTRDLEPEKSVLLEAGFDELGGVSWTKGCYMGQELTARTHYRGLVKRRLTPVLAGGAVPSPGTPILHEGVEVGIMRSGRDACGLALLRVSAITDGPLQGGGVTLTPAPPSWLRLSEDAGAISGSQAASLTT